jgi:hypothetical protein
VPMTLRSCGRDTVPMIGPRERDELLTLRRLNRFVEGPGPRHLTIPWGFGRTVSAFFDH